MSSAPHPPANENAEVASEVDAQGEIALNRASGADEVVGRRGQAPPPRKLTCGGCRRAPGAWQFAAENVLLALDCGHMVCLEYLKLLEKEGSPWSFFRFGLVASIVLPLV